MAYIVTCLDDNGFRQIASQQKTFGTIDAAMAYTKTIDQKRQPIIYAPVMDAPCGMCGNGAVILGDIKSYARCLHCGST